MYNKKRSMAGYLLLFLCCLSCKKFLHVGPPGDELTVNVIFSNDSLAREAINGLYISLMGSHQSLLNGGMSIYPALSADELMRTSFRINDDQFVRNTVKPDNTVLLINFWRTGYAVIFQANICLENLSKANVIAVPTKNQFIGEVKFIRALCYWYLVNLFGDVPLVTSTSVDINMALPRTPVVQIYPVIVADLQDAMSIFPDTGTNTRPNKMAAAALLARAHFYRREWNEAETIASSVINAGNYILSPDLTKVFTKTSPETILQFAPVLSNNSPAEALSFIPPVNNIIPPYNLSNSLFDCFEPGDRRKSNWISTVTINGQTYNYPYKYKVNSTTLDATEYNIVLRLPEQYLIRAEAKAQNGKIDDAIADINTIRNRAGLTSIQTPISLDSCLSVIMQERRKEFFAEWGHRWFDLKRTDRINTELKTYKGDVWQTHDQLYPIPLDELQRNPSLTQNDGY
jgi:starch-binding outer membrane protein, SusD/RagB family